MCVVSHGYGWLGGGRDGWYTCGTKPGGGRMSGDAGGGRMSGDAGALLQSEITH